MARSSTGEKRSNQPAASPDLDAEAAEAELMEANPRPGEEEEEEEEDGTFTVEKIIKHKKKGKDGILYRVRWEGYSPSEDTWEPEANFADDAPIKEYWASVGRGGEANKPTSTSSTASKRKPTKSSDKSSVPVPASKDSTTSRRSSSSKKPDARSTSVQKKAAEEDVEMEEVEEPAPKAAGKPKTKSSEINANGKRGRSSAASEGQSRPDEEVESDEEDEDGEIEEVEIVFDSAIDKKLRGKLLKEKDWEDLVDGVKTLEKGSGPDEITIFLRFKPLKEFNDAKYFVMAFPNSQVNDRCPQVMIRFYEKNLSFRKINQRGQ